MKWLWLGLLGLLFIGQADAQQAVCGWAQKPCVVRGSSGTGGGTPATIGGTAAQVLAANPARKILAISNESATATIACAFGATTAAIYTAGSWTIPPSFTRVWNSFVPTDAVNCISGTAPSGATIEEQ